jgi:hypothetical protein
MFHSRRRYRPSRWYKAATVFAAGALLAVTNWGIPGSAQVYNLKVVTDANPDYSDIGSMIHSITSRWPETKDKCWAIWYWNHIARRQTSPMIVQGRELTDPIRQFNDYGYTMCSTVAGMNCGIWHALGLPVKFWDISLHTVSEVEYDGRWHMYDSSMSAIYTLCDGKTIAAVEDIGAEGACQASGGKREPGHIARYHCLTATSPNGFLTGADTIRSLEEEYRCFNPKGLKYRYYYNNWDLGHRWILNLRDGERYIRYYHRLDANSPNAVPQDQHGNYRADPAYFVPNGGCDPEAANPRYRSRGNGIRTWHPPLTSAGIARNTFSISALQAIEPCGVQPVGAGRPGEVVFHVQGANVITSMTISGELFRRTHQDAAEVAISTDYGRQWKTVWKHEGSGAASPQVTLIQPVNGCYDVLVKVRLLGAQAPGNAQLRDINFDVVTMLNSKTQPRLRLGKNTVYVGAGPQHETLVLWPELQADRYKLYAVEACNVKSAAEHPGYMGALFAEQGGQESYVVFRLDCPRDITRIIYGGRLYNRAPKARIEFHHSFDHGKTWIRSYTLADTNPPWDVIHYEKLENIPAGTKTVLLKYLWYAPSAGPSACSIYDVRMEAHYRPAGEGFRRLDVTFAWKERQNDYSLVARSHRQRVDKLPFTYTINVGGADHPVVESLEVCHAADRPSSAGSGDDQVPPRYGYSDGKDVGGEKFQDRWVSYGPNLADGKPYTCTVPSRNNWGAGDPQGKILTDGIVGPPYVGGIAYRFGALWQKGDNPVVTVDLGSVQKCGAFAIHTGGYPFWDALKGEVKDRVEVLTSVDGQHYQSQGFFDFNLRWKDIPVNHIWPDEETICGHNYLLIPPQPVEARYVRYAITPERFLSVSELQVLQYVRYEAFDLRIALPDGTDRSDITTILGQAAKRLQQTGKR